MRLLAAYVFGCALAVLVGFAASHFTRTMVDQATAVLSPQQENPSQ